SFEVNPSSYEFSEEQIPWLENILEETPEDYHVAVFSHCPPLPVLGGAIKNGTEITKVVSDWNLDNRVVGWFAGHRHVDVHYEGENFPIMILGCNTAEKIQTYADRVPGSVVYDREQGTVTQDLWDTLIITPEDKKFTLVR